MLRRRGRTHKGLCNRCSSISTTNKCSKHNHPRTSSSSSSHWQHPGISTPTPNTWLWKAIKEKKERLFQETYVAMEVFNALQPGPDGFLYKALLLENWKKSDLSLDAYRLAYTKYPNEEKVQHVR